MEDAVVLTSGYDGCVCELSSTTNEFTGEFRLYLVFGHAGLDEAEDAPEALVGDGYGFLQQFDFLLALDQPELMQERRQAAEIVEGEITLAFPDEAQVAGLHLVGGALVLVGV
tara:strand:- start:38 stop:376 length:339 start_codon:yes stop_codon:yes gene_type:complete